jgi:hypothetical protein
VTDLLVAVAEKLKNPGLPLLCGILLGACAAWMAINTIHQERFTVLEAARKDLEQQVSVLETSKKTQDAEISRLREQLGSVSPSKTRKELEAFIQRSDKEIAQKHEEFARNSPNFWSRDDPPGGRPLTEREKSTRDRFEKELDRLAGQRDEAHRKLIELTAK